MGALARHGSAVLAVLVCLVAPFSTLHPRFESAAVWRSSLFETAIAKLGAFVQLKPRVAVRLVAIDDAATGRIGPWPWTNEQIRVLAERARAAGARSVLVELAEAREPRGTVRDWKAVRLDPRVKGDIGVVNSAWAGAGVEAHARIPLLVADGRQIRPSRVAATALSLVRADAARVAGSAAQGTWSLRISGVRTIEPTTRVLEAWETTPDGSLWLLPPEAPTGFAALSALRVMEAEALTDLNGAVAVIRRAELSSRSPAWAETQALAQLLNNQTPARPDWARLAELIAAVVAAAVVSQLMMLGRTRAAIIAAIGLTIAASAASAGLLILRLELLDPVVTAAFAAVALLVSGIALGLRRAASAPAAERSEPAPRKARARKGAVERLEVSALSCEIRDLAALTELYKDTPAAVARITSKVMNTAADMVRAHRGRIEHLGADRLVAVFNHDGSDQKHAARAAEAALAVLGRLEPMNEALEKSLTSAGIVFSPVQLSLGVETADAIVADLGLKPAHEPTAFGPAIDAAAALSARAKSYGPAILVGPGTQDLVSGGFALLELDLAPDSGVNRPFYALLGNPVLRANPKFKALREGFAAFHQAYRKGNWEQAGQLLDQCAKLPGAAPKLVELYDRRLAFLKASPPGEGWEGILKLPIE